MRALLVLTVLLITSCASTRSSHVGARMILPPLAATVQAEPDEMFLMAGHLNPERLPDYPVEQMASGPETLRLCVDIVVDEGGDVVRASPLYDGPECAAGPTPLLVPFEQAALAAVRDWQFIAAAICRFPPGTEKNDRCEGAGVTERAVPLRMAFVFDFSRREGRARVAPAPGS